MANNFTPSCPIPITKYPKIILAHGGGGTMMHQLIDGMFIEAFGNPVLKEQLDAAVMNTPKGQLAMTTDSYVVNPIIFPGGDIGMLAINGTVNDLCMVGATPQYVSVGFILEEGLPVETLWKIVCSIKDAAEESGIKIVTGDTKVVEKGKGDGIFINTTGIGFIEAKIKIGPAQIKEGDVIIVSGDLGRHGMAIMAVREGLAFKNTIESDAASLKKVVHALIKEGIDVHCLRDLTRGGLASALNEIAQAAGAHLHIEERNIPVQEDVKGACEILGLDPLYVACEGRFITFVNDKDAKRALSIIKKFQDGKNAMLMGTVRDLKQNKVTLTTLIGMERILDLPSGEQLPRIC